MHPGRRMHPARQYAIGNRQKAIYLNKHRIYPNKLDIFHFYTKNIVFNPRGVFSPSKKTAGRPRTGTQPKVIFTRNASF